MTRTCPACRNQKKSGSCKVIVASRDIKSLTIAEGAAVVLDPAEAGLRTAQLTAVASPAYADDRSVNWASDAEGVATVDENGLVTAVAAAIGASLAVSGQTTLGSATLFAVAGVCVGVVAVVATA